MTKTEAEALCEKLQTARVDHEVRTKYLKGSPTCSVRAYLKPFTYESDEHSKAYAKNIIDIMADGDWCIGGEQGQAYVCRY